MFKSSKLQTEFRIAFILGEGLILKTCVCFLLKENPRLSSQKMEAKMAALRTERQARSKVSSICYSVDHEFLFSSRPCFLSLNFP